MGSTLRSAYAWILLSAIILPLFPVALVFWAVGRPFDPRRDRLRRMVAVWSSLYGATSPLYRFDFQGRENLPESGPYVLVANHESGLDVLILLMLKTPARFLAESWLFRVPLAGSLLRRCEHIPVRIGDRESGRRALEAAAESLAAGTPVAVFPGGDYALEGLGEFRPGAFVAAHRAGVPIIPVRIRGSAKAWKPGTVVVQGRNPIRVDILTPLPAEVVASTDPGELLKRVREEMESAA